MYVIILFVFFFKQKTAYEMRISDWSSDVCSSDLQAGDHDVAAFGQRIADTQRAVVRNADDVARKRFLGHLAVLREEQHRAADRDRLARSALHQPHPALELARTQAHEGDAEIGRAHV